MSGLEQHLLEIVRRDGPLKATEAATKLSRLLQRDITRQEVNQVLYGPLSTQVVKDSRRHTWTLANQQTTTPSRAKALRSTAKPRPTKASKKGVSKKVAATRAPPPLNPEQSRLVTLEPSGNLLIRGEAGSGKTSVLAARAGWMQSALGSGGLLFVTYNRALCANVARLLASLGVSSGVTVLTYHDWAKATAKALGVAIKKWARDEDRQRLLPEILGAMKSRWGNHRLFAAEDSFWQSEFEWISGRGFDTESEYVSAARTGRQQHRVAVSERSVVWHAFQAYRRRLSEEGLWSIDDPAGLVREGLSRRHGAVDESLRYEHVFVDEVQDFDKSWLSVLSPFATDSLSLAGDLSQRIYSRSFTWKEAGIRIVPARSRSLPRSHRTTRQVLAVATRVLSNGELTMDPDYVAPGLCDRDGPPITLIRRSGGRDARDALASYIVRLRAKNPKESIGVLVPTGRTRSSMKRALEAADVPCYTPRYDDPVEDPGRVSIVTYHSAKGLEWDHVAVAGLEDENMPAVFLRNFEGVDDLKQQLEQLRRLLFVAMTRARTSLVLAGGEPFCRFFDDIGSDDMTSA